MLFSYPLFSLSQLLFELCLCVFCAELNFMIWDGSTWGLLMPSQELPGTSVTKIPVLNGDAGSALLGLGLRPSCLPSTEYRYI
jgi:hypothetical protein